MKIEKPKIGEYWILDNHDIFIVISKKEYELNGGHRDNNKDTFYTKFIDRQREYTYGWDTVSSIPQYYKKIPGYNTPLYRILNYEH